MPSTSSISITNDMLFDLNGRKNKSITGLFDGDVNTGINITVTNEDAFIIPYSSFVVLDNVYNNFVLEYYDFYGDGTSLTVRLYDDTKTIQSTHILTTEGFAVWKTASGISDSTNVRFVEITTTSGADIYGIYELRLYGDVVSTASSIYPGTTIDTITDPGKYAHGVNILDDRLARLDASGSSILQRVAKAVRVAYEATKWDWYPDHYINPGTSSFWLGRTGTGSMDTRIFDVAGPADIKVQFYRMGGSIQNVSESIASNNSGYIYQANTSFRMPSGSHKESASSWAWTADIFYKMVALWGSNPLADTSSFYAFGGDASPGQNGVETFEIGNEDNKDWLGADANLSPKAYYQLINAVYHRTKQADPNSRIFAGAITFMDPTFWRAVYFHHYWASGSNAVFPCDGFNMNCYLNSDLDGQGGSGTGLNPEAWNLLSRVTELKTIFNTIFPNKILHWSEFGVATDNGSPWLVNAISPRTAKEVAGDVALRIKAIAQTVQIVSRMYYYAFFEDSSYPFNSMALTQDTYHPIDGYYTGTNLYGQAYALANELEIEQNYNWFSSLITDGGTSSVWVTRKNHQSNSNKKLFKTWMGTMTGSTAISYSLNVGTGASSATLYTRAYSQYSPVSQSIPVSANTVIIPTVSEGMSWLEVTYSGESQKYRRYYKRRRWN